MFPSSVWCASGGHVGLCICVEQRLIVVRHGSYRCQYPEFSGGSRQGDGVAQVDLWPVCLNHYRCVSHAPQSHGPTPRPHDIVSARRLYHKRNVRYLPMQREFYHSRRSPMLFTNAPTTDTPRSSSQKMRARRLTSCSFSLLCLPRLGSSGSQQHISWDLSRHWLFGETNSSI